MIKLLLLVAFFCVGCAGISNEGSGKIVYNGIPWFDNQGNIVNAHGACIVEDNGRYYLFGEYKSDKSNAFPWVLVAIPQMIW